MSRPSPSFQARTKGTAVIVYPEGVVCPCSALNNLRTKEAEPDSGISEAVLRV